MRGLGGSSTLQQKGEGCAEKFTGWQHLTLPRRAAAAVEEVEVALQCHCYFLVGLGSGGNIPVFRFFSGSAASVVWPVLFTSLRLRETRVPSTAVDF